MHEMFYIVDDLSFCVLKDDLKNKIYKVIFLIY